MKYHTKFLINYFIMESRWNELVRNSFEEPQRKKVILTLGTVAYLIMLFLPLANIKGHSVTGWKMITDLLFEEFHANGWFLYIGFIAPIIALVRANQKEKVSKYTGIIMLALPISILMFGFMFVEPLIGFYIYTAFSVLMIAMATESFKNKMCDKIDNK